MDNRTDRRRENIAVVCGGRSREREISLRSGQAVLNALRNQGLNASVVDGAQALLREVDLGKVDRVFNILHGGEGENGALAGALQVLNVPFTGCDVAGAALSMDKARSKVVVAAAGVRVAEGLAVTRHMPMKQLDAWLSVSGQRAGRWIVKPNNEGSSVGLYQAHAPDEVAEAVQAVLSIAPVALVEEFIAGDECTVAIVNDHVLPVVRIEPAEGLYDYAAKYTSSATRYHCPSGFEPPVDHELQANARTVFDALGLRGWARMDFILDEQRRPWFLEANTTPGMTETSLVPKAAAAYGWDFQRLVREILATSHMEALP